MTKYEIAVLAEDYESKRIRFEALGMMNAHGQTPDKRIATRTEYEVARAEKERALVALLKAQAAYAGGP